MNLRALEPMGLRGCIPNQIGVYPPVRRKPVRQLRKRRPASVLYEAQTLHGLTSVTLILLPYVIHGNGPLMHIKPADI